MPNYTYDPSNTVQFQRNNRLYADLFLPALPSTTPRKPKVPPRASKHPLLESISEEVCEITKAEFRAALAAAERAEEEQRSKLAVTLARPSSLSRPRHTRTFQQHQRIRFAPQTTIRHGRSRGHLDTTSATKHASLRNHVILWIVLVIVAWGVVMLGPTLWRDEPARLYELRLLSEGVLHDLWEWVVAL